MWMLLVLLTTSLTLADGKTEGNLVSFKFDNATNIIKLTWNTPKEVTAQLVDDGSGACIYEGYFPTDIGSTILVTGCESDYVCVQIHSKQFGSYLFCLVKGDIHYPTVSAADYQDDIVNEEFDKIFGVKTKRDGRFLDYYSYDDEPIENVYFEENYDDPESEVEVQKPPPKLVLNINVYLDKHWYSKFGPRAESTARKVLKQAQALFIHNSLETQIDLQYGDRIYPSSAPALKANKKGHRMLENYLKKPFTIGAEEKTVSHLHLLADDPYSNKPRYPSAGKAKIQSACDQFPRALAKYKYRSNELDTAMTVAHELGHLLGMHHDFKANGDKREKCSRKRKGGSVMNYGPKRLSWSSCSNVDFKEYYDKVFRFKEGKFCLRDPSAKGCVCNGVIDAVGNGECKQGVCFVDAYSTCPDIQVWADKKMSKHACDACSADQFECNAGACIPASQRCDGLVRNCPQGEDERGCPFVGFEFK